MEPTFKFERFEFQGSGQLSWEREFLVALFAGIHNWDLHGKYFQGQESLCCRASGRIQSSNQQWAHHRPKDPP